MSSSAAPYGIKTPAAVLAEDVICQSFIQSSSTLAYACLALRRGRHDLAAHVLHSLEGRPASRFKDMVFYLQCQIGIEVGDFAEVKRRLVPRVHQHPNDMVALSLLESCVFCEYEDWRRRNPHLAAEEHAARTLAEERAAEEAEAGRSSALADRLPEAHAAAPAEADPYARFAPPSEPSPEPAPDYRTSAVPEIAAVSSERVASPNHLGSGSDSIGSLKAIPQAPQAFHPEPARPAVSREEAAPRAEAPRQAPVPETPYAAASTPAENDLGIYQGLAADPNTQAISLWNAQQRRMRSAYRNPQLEPLVATLPQVLPHGLEEAVRALDGGDIHKICLSFQGLTLTSLHAGAENLGLVTGNINQSLLTMVRAENIFLKQGAGARGAVGAPGAGRPDSGLRGRAAEAVA